MAEQTDDKPQGGKTDRSFLWRLAPLVGLAVAAALLFGFGLDQYLTFETLKENRGHLLNWVSDHAVLAAVAYIVVYAAAIVLVPPTGAVMTVTGGFLFGPVAATLYVMVGATTGATALFLTVKLSVGERFRKWAGPALERMRAGFQENELSYMFVLRLIPLFPFWLVNVAPAFLGVGLGTFVIGTFFGIIPATVVFTLFGAGIGGILDSNAEVTLAGVLTPEIIAGLVGLACLALLPVLYKKLKARRA